MNESIVLSSTDTERLIALEKQPDGLARAVRYIEDKIAEGVAAGRFTEAAARADFGSAGVLARYLLCMKKPAVRRSPVRYGTKCPKGLF